MRIRTVFQQHKHYVLKKRKDGVIAFKRIEDTYCIKEGNLALFFVLAIMLTLGALVGNIFTDYKYHYYFPLHNLNQCIPTSWDDQNLAYPVPNDKVRYQLQNAFIFDAIIIFCFVLLGFFLRNIPREFSIMSEIVMITWVLIIEAIVRNNLAIFEIQSMFANEVDEAYIFIFFNFAIMMISGMFLLRLSYQPN